MSPREAEQRAFLETYWRCLVVEPDWERFASIVAEDCVVHYPGNHFLSGDHVGRAAVVRLYQTSAQARPGARGRSSASCTTPSIPRTTAVRSSSTGSSSATGVEIEGDAVGVFHLQDGQMTEYWLLERDQKMINDIFNMGGKALLAGGAAKDMAQGRRHAPAGTGPNRCGGSPASSAARTRGWSDGSWSDPDGAQRPGGRSRRAARHHLSRGPDHGRADDLADHGHVLRRARAQQRDRPGVVLLARAPVPVRGHDRGRRLGRPARHALPARRRRGPAQVADPRPEGHPGRLRRRHPRPAHARAGRPDRLHLARGLRLRGRRGRDLLAAAPAAVLRRPAGLLDRHPLDVGQAGRRAGLQGLRPGAAERDAVHRRLRLHHDVPVGVHDQRHADERLRRRLPGELQGRLHRPDVSAQRAG